MKLIKITFGTGPTQPSTREGWYIIGHAARSNGDGSGGGRTSVGGYIKRLPAKLNEDGTQLVEPSRMPTWTEAAAIVFQNMSARPEWPKFVRGKQSENEIRLSVPDELDQVDFFAEYNPDQAQRAPHELNPPEVTISQESF